MGNCAHGSYAHESCARGGLNMGNLERISLAVNSSRIEHIANLSMH